MLYVCVPFLHFSATGKNIISLSGPQFIPPTVTFSTGRFCAREYLYAITVVGEAVHLTDKLIKDSFATNSHVQLSDMNVNSR